MTILLLYLESSLNDKSVYAMKYFSKNLAKERQKYLAATASLNMSYQTYLILWRIISSVS